MNSSRIMLGILVYTYMSIAISSDTIETEQSESARKILRNFISDHKAPGLQYMFVDDKQVLFNFETGLADVEQQTPVTSSTTFNGYSITKTVTAAAVVKLAQQGKINLDAPVNQYLPQLTYNPSPTARQLLLHTAGVPNPNPIKWIHKNEDHANFDENAFIQQVINDNASLNSTPGDEFAYSNVGYLILAQLVQNVSGKTFDQYVTDEIITPLSLSASENISFNIDDPSFHARGYIRKWNWLNLLLGIFIDRDTYMESAVNGWSAFKLFMPNGKAYGGLVGNAAGFARYLQAILNRHSPFDGSMTDLLFETGRKNDGEILNRTMGWAKSSRSGLTYYSHTGGGGGYYCEIRIYPDINRASVIMTNKTGISPQNYLDLIDPVFLRGFVSS